MSTKHHPAWEIYDLHRLARLRVKYFCACLDTVRRRNFVIEWVLAATASGSAVAGFAFWEHPTGKVTWQLLTVASAVLAIAKPLLNYADRTQRLEELVSGYRLVEHRLTDLEGDLVRSGSYTPALQDQFRTIRQDEKEFALKQPTSSENKTLKRRCQAEVVAELPLDSFYIPED